MTVAVVMKMGRVKLKRQIWNVVLLYTHYQDAVTTSWYVNSDDGDYYIDDISTHLM